MDAKNVLTAFLVVMRDVLIYGLNVTPAVVNHDAAGSAAIVNTTIVKTILSVAVTVAKPSLVISMVGG